MIAIIRISGLVNVPSEVAETLSRIYLKRKYACTLLADTPENRKLLNKVRNYVAYGEINAEMLKDLIQSRGVLKDKTGKLDAEKIAKELEKTPIGKTGIKPFFRLHPPRGGIDAKKHFGVSKKAVLGDNKEKINDLLRRML